MDRYDFSMRLERDFVEYVDRLADAKGMGKGEFAAKVWPEDSRKAAANRWSAIRNTAANTGKPQGLPVSDAYRISRVLGFNLGLVLTLLEDRGSGGRTELTNAEGI